MLWCVFLFLCVMVCEMVVFVLWMVVLWVIEGGVFDDGGWILDRVCLVWSGWEGVL